MLRIAGTQGFEKQTFPRSGLKRRFATPKEEGSPFHGLITTMQFRTGAGSVWNARERPVPKRETRPAPAA